MNKCIVCNYNFKGTKVQKVCSYTCKEKMRIAGINGTWSSNKKIKEKTITYRKKTEDQRFLTTYNENDNDG